MIGLRHRHPSLWTPRTIPSGPVEIDWAHPLSSGLIGCYVPGSYAGMADLVGMGPTLFPGSGGQFPKTPAGYGYGCTSLNASASSIPAGTTPSSATVPIDWIVQNGGTLFWHGIAVGPVILGSGFDVNLVGITFGGDAGNLVPPTVAVGLGIQNSFVGHFAAFFYQSAGSSQRSLRSAVVWDNSMAGLPVSMAASFTVGGPINLYIWSVSTSTPPQSVPSVTSEIWRTSGPPDSTQFWNFSIGVPQSMDDFDASNSITSSVCLYDRPLSAPEVNALNASPFAMLRPAARRLRVPDFVSEGPGPYRRWNRTYLIR